MGFAALEWHNFIRDFVTLLVVIDPIGTVPVFLFATAGLAPHLHRAIAVRAVLIAGCVLIAFLIGGQFLLEALGLRLGAFQIAGGIILFLFALSMIFGESKPESEIEHAAHEDLSRAVFPLAIPSIASPGAMLAVVILTDNHAVSVTEQTVIGGLLLAVLVITFIFMLLASAIQRWIGSTGASVVSRVMGLILATLAVDSVLNGFETIGVLDIIPAG